MTFNFENMFHLSKLIPRKNYIKLPNISRLFSSVISIDEFFKSFNKKITTTQLNELSFLIENKHEDITLNRKPRLIKDGSFVKVSPTPLKKPKLISLSYQCLKECLNINISKSDPIYIELSRILTHIFNGDQEYLNKYLSNCIPYSHCYAGHQFGNFAGQLGDGRAISIGEYELDDNQVSKRFEMQLKGVCLTLF